MVTVAVLDDWQGVARDSADWSALLSRARVRFLREPFADEADAVRQLQDAQIVLSMRERTPLPPTLIRELKNLKMLGITGLRVSSLDLDTCTAQGVVVCHTAAATEGIAAPAELALGLLLCVVRSIPAADAGIRAGRFQAGIAPGYTLAGRTLGILGLGRLGGLMASYGRALGMQLLAWSENLTPAQATAAGAQWVSRDELFSRSDAVSIHLVLSPRSRHIVGAAQIALMKPGAILINTSRGPLVDEAALMAALAAGRIYAGLDVFDREPLAANDPWRQLPGTVLTPHLGYCVTETFRQFYTQSVENALAFLSGAPIRVSNPQALATRANP